MTDERRVEVAAEADAAHLMWRGEPQHKPTRWTCSGCGTVVTSPAERDASRTAHAALVADLRALVDKWTLPERKPFDPLPDDRDAGLNAAARRIAALLDRHAPEEGRCVCSPGFCVGVPGDSDTCKVCLALDPEAGCALDRPASDGGT